MSQLEPAQRELRMLLHGLGFVEDQVDILNSSIRQIENSGGTDAQRSEVGGSPGLNGAVSKHLAL